MTEGIQLRQVKYLNNIVKRDHRFIKKRIRAMLRLKSLRTAKRIISGIEAMHMIKKGQTLQRENSVQNQKEFILQVFRLFTYGQGFFIFSSSICTRAPTIIDKASELFSLPNINSDYGCFSNGIKLMIGIFPCLNAKKRRN